MPYNIKNMAKKLRLLTTSLAILAIFHGTVKATDLPKNTPVIEVSIANNNLFLSIKRAVDQPVNAVVLKLGKGKKIKIKSSVGTHGETIIFLDARDAYKLKKYGIKSVAYETPKGIEKIRITEQENNKILSSLP